MNKFFPLFIFFLGISLFAHSQSANLLHNRDYNYLIDRYEVLSGRFSSEFYTTVKPYTRKGLAAWIDTIATSNRIFNSGPDQFNRSYLANDNWAWSQTDQPESKKSLLGVFYRNKPDLFHVNTDDFKLRVNPVIHFQVGKETSTGFASTPLTYVNTRGIQIEGAIDGKVGFYTFLSENQALFPAYVRERNDDSGVIPGEGFWKRFKEDGVDFFSAKGYITVQASKHIGVQLGYDKNFIGNGFRSLILSDYAPSYFFLKINTRVWRINYTNLFAEMRADVFVAPGGVGLLGTQRFPKKYFALHHLGIDITRNFNIGLFEAIVFGQDPAMGNSGFELSYLNPVIFYRAIEQQTGSPDNAILGGDFKWNVGKRFSFYGQLVLDEFILGEIRSGSGWWGNKYAAQIGMKYMNAFRIPNLDIQLEYNLARPYAYAHESNYTNYAHYRQPLAHPLGANFKENIVIARYQPMNRLTLTGKLIFAKYGADTTDTNWGGNVLLNYATHEQEFNNEIGQGIPTDLLYAELRASYQLIHNLFIDLGFIQRKLSSNLSALERKSTLATLAVRWNIPARNAEF